MSEGESRRFLRDSSGVIRNVSGPDVFIYHIALINIGIGTAFILLLGPAFYQSSNLWLATLLTGFFLIFQNLTYYCFSVTMPRSGGHYTFISRSIHPAIAFMLSFSMVIWTMATVGQAATYLSTLGLSPFFQVYGEILGSDMLISISAALSPPPGGFIAGTIPTLIIGTIAISAMVGLLAVGTKAVFRVYWFSMIIALVGSLAMLWVFYTTPRQEFIELFNNFAQGTTYSGLIETAKENGWSNKPVTFASTLAFMVWPFYPLAAGVLSSSFAGEIKNVERSQLYGMAGPVALSAILMALIVVGAIRMMGYEFLAAVGFTFFLVPEQAVQIIPWNSVFAGIASTNPIIVFLVMIGGLMWSWSWIPGSLIFGSRIILAWSIDQVVPRQLGRVSLKYNSPFVAVIVSGIVAWVWLFLFTFLPVSRALVAIGAITITFATVGLSAVIFPYRRQEMYENSPISQYEFLGIPAMSVVGFITMIYMLGMVYFFFTDPLIAATSTESLVVVGGIFVTGLVVFYGMRYYRRAYQNIDIDKAFDEIPVE